MQTGFALFFSLTLLYKIICRTFLYTDLKEESVKKTEDVS